MAEFVSPDELIFPTRNDVSPTLNQGKRWSEETLNLWLSKFTASFIESGFTLPATDPDLNIDVSAGTALLDGYLVDFPTTITVIAIDDSLSFLFLRLKKTSGVVTEGVLAIEASDVAAGPEEILIAQITAAGGVITATLDLAARDQLGDFGDIPFASI